MLSALQARLALFRGARVFRDHDPQLRRSFGACAFRGPVFGTHSDPVALLGFRFRLFRLRRTVMSGIFRAIDRCPAWWIVIEIGPPDAEFLAVRVDPFPQEFARNPSFRACRALDTDDVGRESVAIAATKTSAVERPVARGF